MEPHNSPAHLLTRGGRVYVLRVWYENQDPPGDPDRPPVWRASLREGTDGPRRSFASIDDCIDHLYGEFLRR